MRIIEVPRHNWSKALNQFSSVYGGCLVSLDMVGAIFGFRAAISNLPLLGVTAETTPQRTDITISATRPPHDHVTHTVHAPIRVSIRRANDGSDAGLEIESSEGVAMLRLKSRVPPRPLNEVVRG